MTNKQAIFCFLPTLLLGLGILFWMVFPGRSGLSGDSETLADELSAYAQARSLLGAE